MAYIKGNFKKYIFVSGNGYTVGLFRVKETDLDMDSRTITFTGYLPELNEIDNYKFEGELVFHERYGEQFNVNNYEVLLPDDNDNIISFLSSELFKGIGKTKAKKIVDTLGEDSLNIILSNSDSLLEVKDLTKKQRDTIYNSLLEYRSSYDRMLKLTSVGFSIKNAIKIEKFYSLDVDYILKHPYQIIEDIPEITFPIVDKLKINLNIESDNSERISYGIIYAINDLSFRTGNIYFSYEELISATVKLLFVDVESINNGITSLVASGKIIIDNDKYILTDIYDASMYIADRIISLTSVNNEKNYNDEVESLEKEIGYIFNNEQKEAITNALNCNFSVITGGPGTGKTTIIKAITNIYREINNLKGDKINNDLVLLAPTGRASKRMSQNSGLPSYTIHRFLKWQKESNTFMVNEENKSHAKCVIIDEASMVDENLLYNLFLGLEDYCKVIMIGDYNQLPSVGPGQVLKDIIESECVQVTYLEKLYRQSKNSNINFFAKSIVEGNIDFSWFNKSDDLTFVTATDKNLKDILSEFLETYEDVSIYEKQVLAPRYKGENGIDSLNDFCQGLLNNGFKKELKHGDCTYKENDKVLGLVNNVEDNVFNGDIGEIINIKGTSKKEITINFDGNIVKYGASNFDDFTLGYTISIHKAQGSEFDVVILPVLNSYGYMLYRKLIYTAVTRAKKHLIIIGEEEALKKAILTDRDENRKTLLKNFIKEY